MNEENLRKQEESISKQEQMKKCKFEWMVANKDVVKMGYSKITFCVLCT